MFFDVTFVSFFEVLMDEFDHFQIEFGAETNDVFSEPPSAAQRVRTPPPFDPLGSESPKSQNI